MDPCHLFLPRAVLCTGVGSPGLRNPTRASSRGSSVSPVPPFPVPWRVRERDTVPRSGYHPDPDGWDSERGMPKPQGPQVPGEDGLGRN